MTGLRLDLYLDAIDDLEDDDNVQAELLARGDAIASTARSNARSVGLVETGEGAASIHAEPITDEDGRPAVGVGWDEKHFYMLFGEIGTEHQPATPFLRPALEQHAG